MSESRRETLVEAQNENSNPLNATQLSRGSTVERMRAVHAGCHSYLDGQYLDWVYINQRPRN